MDLLDRMFGYDRWATAQLLEKSRVLTDEQLDQEFDVGLRTLRETFHHMIYVIEGWTAQMDGKPHPPEREGKPSIAELEELFEKNFAYFESVSRKIIAEDRINELFKDHYNVPQSLGGTFLQLFTHHVHHRSEARHILVRLGVEGLWDYDPQEFEHVAGKPEGINEGINFG